MEQRQEGKTCQKKMNMEEKKMFKHLKKMSESNLQKKWFVMAYPLKIIQFIKNNKALNHQ